MPVKSTIIDSDVVETAIRMRLLDQVYADGYTTKKFYVKSNYAYFTFSRTVATREEISVVRVYFPSLISDPVPAVEFTFHVPVILRESYTLTINYTLEWWRGDGRDDNYDVTLPIPPSVEVTFELCLCA